MSGSELPNAGGGSSGGFGSGGSGGVGVGSIGGVSGGGMQNPPTGPSQPVIPGGGSSGGVGGGMENPPLQAVIQNIPVSLGSERNAGYRVVAGDNNGDGMRLGESSRRRRGRPRKYSPEIATPVPLSSVPPQPIPTYGTFVAPPPPPQQQLPLQEQPPVQQHQPPLPHQQPLQPQSPVQQQPPLQQQPHVQQQSPLQQQQSPLQQQPPVQQQPPLQQQPPVQQQPPLQLQLPVQQHQPPLPPQMQPLPPLQEGGSRRRPRGRPAERFTHSAQLGSSANGLTPHVIIVNTGEDVSSKIMSFTQNGPRTICVLSANGAISSVRLRRITSPDSIETFEGRYEILSLTGSFMLSNSGGPRSRAGALSVVLASSDGEIVGGSVAGPLTAASPVQVVLASFVREDGPLIWRLTEPVFYPPANPRAVTGPARPNTPPSRGTFNDSGGAGRPINQGAGATNSTPPTMSGSPFQ